MSKKIRFTIRVKLTIMSMISIAVAVSTLGVILAISFSNSAFQTASTTLDGVATNAALALENSIISAETSMKLLTNQIGYNTDFANNIVNYKDSEEARTKVAEAMAGHNKSGDGSTIIGAMDYLIISDIDIESATMYSPYINESVYDRLMPVNRSVITYTEELYKELAERRGRLSAARTSGIDEDTSGTAYRERKRYRG